MTEGTQTPPQDPPQGGEGGKEGQGGGSGAGAPPPDAGKPVVPEKYEFKVPEGALLDKADVERIAAYARERGLSQEDAQKVLERDSATLASYADRQKAQQEEVRDSWAKATETDKELGGEKLREVTETARRVLDRFGSEEFKTQLNETGLGNHPELIRILYRVGKVLSDDRTILGGSTSSAAPKSAAEVIYGTKEEK